MNEQVTKFIRRFLTIAASSKGLGIKLIRVAILTIFVWIGGLKYYHYEADGIVPFVANSPFMSFFYNKQAPEYKEYKNAEGAYVIKNREWHQANGTYTFAHCLGALICTIGILVFLGLFFPRNRHHRGYSGHYHDHRNLVISCHDTRSMGPQPGKRGIWLSPVIRGRTPRD